uniref:Uncharacterized protein n=1 Tax=Sphaerodactylus townsendi TaxID=933632 RepID=A0ACB8FIU0_9SAUR
MLDSMRTHTRPYSWDICLVCSHQRERTNGQAACLKQTRESAGTNQQMIKEEHLDQKSLSCHRDSLHVSPESYNKPKAPGARGK